MVTFGYSVQTEQVHPDEKANRLLTNPACIAGVLVSRANFKALCGRSKWCFRHQLWLRCQRLLNTRVRRGPAVPANAVVLYPINFPKPALRMDP